MDDVKLEMILCIVNTGFSETAMEAARQCGAGGGTVLRARGTANAMAEKTFQITVQPEKEIVMILVPVEKRNDILHALYRAVGQNTPGHGIVVALPVDESVGIGRKTEKPSPAPQENRP